MAKKKPMTFLEQLDNLERYLKKNMLYNANSNPVRRRAKQRVKFFA